ncbi:hypothetical protein QR680_017948 [Steinernema hermaphroditum]|uniref:DUF4794 domain-containing protein n=1 Tax=Steinernema hermaphroditum TaxID=289476 RepID=A0AA39HIL4_9BILA|nr:hypothetical protein QR680_017948 [Steinernema hermaphroditum]
MKVASALLLLALLGAEAKYIFKRGANSYGDEPVTVAPSVTVSVVTPVEQAISGVNNPSAAAEAPAPSIQASGYRKKRSLQNGYGDEATAAPVQHVPVVNQAEQAPSGIQNPTAAAEAPAPSVQSSGYRKRRNAQNGYGDEATVAPVQPLPAVNQVEQAPLPMQNPSAAAIAPSPSVQSSGYRKKRSAQNGYGDEPSTASSAPAPAPLVAPVEQPVSGVNNPSAAAEAPAPSVQSSGYRKKRGLQNGYGDEATVAPVQPLPAVNQVEQAPQPVQNPSAAAIAPSPSVQSSGYRKKRNTQNAYGDEHISLPATLSPVTNPPPVELPPVGVEQPSASAQTAAIQASGY